MVAARAVRRGMRFSSGSAWVGLRAFADEPIEGGGRRSGVRQRFAGQQFGEVARVVAGRGRPVERSGELGPRRITRDVWVELGQQGVPAQSRIGGVLAAADGVQTLGQMGLIEGFAGCQRFARGARPPVSGVGRVPESQLGCEVGVAPG